MKKRIFITLLMVGIISVSYSQSASQSAFNKGDNLLNVGIGVNSYYSGGIPIGASYEKGISDVISVGGNFDYLSTKYFTVKFTALYFGVRGSYHLKLNVDKFDVYGGPTIGYRSFSWSSKYEGVNLGGSYGNGLFVGIFIGGKYYFSEKIGVFAELGAIGSTNARLGVAFKL
jgi:hypothetical protein